MNIEIIAMECDKDHTHLFLNSIPTQSPSSIMHEIKGYTSRILAADVSSETIKQYVESQKKNIINS